ncbi:MAG: succinyl-diaminopimelate desuccinylase [Pseudomonadota bacterium]|nr:succinyl-diaminopimelate desuccinylase [Pseudomonadota bacterium]
MNKDSLNILSNLISKKSVTPEDDGCQDYIFSELKEFGFELRDLSENNVKNSLIFQSSKKSPNVLFAGHTDVVPAGNINDWDSDPFTPTIKDNVVYGRGCSDMKSSIACMIAATKRFVLENPNHNGSIGFLLTSDEEGPADFGTKVAIEKMKDLGYVPDFTIVGEPTSSKTLGDTIKNGRRGSITGELIINGVQGHIAYPELAVNPNHYTGKIINDLIKHNWCSGNKYFPATSLQVSSIISDQVASNMIPAKVKVIFNLRFSSELTEDKIKSTVKSLIDAHEVDYDISWTCSAHPFITNEGKLTDTLKAAIRKTIHHDPVLSTNGGTSDARFLSKVSNETVEFGGINQTAHKINENINIDDLFSLEKIYHESLCLLLLD